MTRVIGAPNATLAVATPAQAFVLAGLVRLSSRRPVLVITPTGATAEQLAHDLAAFTDGPAQDIAQGVSADRASGVGADGRPRRPPEGKGSTCSRHGRPFPSSG